MSERPTNATRCQHCHRPEHEHVSVTIPGWRTDAAAGAPVMLRLCPTSLYLPACEMCDRYPCRCAEVFTPKGGHPAS